MVQWRLERQFERRRRQETFAADQERYEELKKQLAEFDSLKPTPLPMAMAVADIGRDAPPTHLLDGGELEAARSRGRAGLPGVSGGIAPEPTVDSPASIAASRRPAAARSLAVG